MVLLWHSLLLLLLFVECNCSLLLLILLLIGHIRIQSPSRDGGLFQSLPLPHRLKKLRFDSSSYKINNPYDKSHIKSRKSKYYGCNKYK